MITTGSKWFYGFGFLSLVLAAAYGWTTGGNGLGPVSVGYKGAVGDHFGYGVLLSAGVVSLVFGFVATAVARRRCRAVAQVAGTDTVPAVLPVRPSYWPPVAAFGAAGGDRAGVRGRDRRLRPHRARHRAGRVVQTWADHATGDPETNRRIRNRLMNPIEYPAAGLLALGLPPSRLFLALSVESAVWVADGGRRRGDRRGLHRRRPAGHQPQRRGRPAGGCRRAGHRRRRGRAVAGTREFHEHEEEASTAPPPRAPSPPTVGSPA